MKYEKLVNKLINKSFPHLKNKKPKILRYRIFKDYAFYLPVFNVILINKKCDRFSDKEKIGLLAHELSHAEQASRLEFFKKISLFLSYWLSKKTRKRIEVQADRLVIKKGYAKELLEMTKAYEKEFGKARYGGSSKQIKSMTKRRNSQLN